jgi:hypothetical protein
MSISSIGGSFGTIRPETATRQTSGEVARDTASAVKSISDQTERAAPTPSAGLAPSTSPVAPAIAISAMEAAKDTAATGADRRQGATRAYGAAAQLG